MSSQRTVLDERTRESSPIAPPRVLRKNPIIAVLLSGFPGMGNIYNGLYRRGMAFFIVIAALFPVAERQEIFGFVIAFFWIFNMIDAGRQATLINHGYAEDPALADMSVRVKANEGGLLVGVMLIVVGLFAALDLYFDISLEFLVNFWPVVLIAVGGWMVRSWYRDRRKSLTVSESDADWGSASEAE